MIETDYKVRDKVETPHGVGTVAAVGAQSPWRNRPTATGKTYVWVVLDAPFRPRHQLLYDEPKHWVVRGGWDAASLRRIGG